MCRGREEELGMDLRDEAIHKAAYRSFGFREIPGYTGNPLPGIIYLALDLPPAA